MIKSWRLQSSLSSSSSSLYAQGCNWNGRKGGSSLNPSTCPQPPEIVLCYIANNIYATIYCYATLPCFIVSKYAIFHCWVALRVTYLQHCCGTLLRHFAILHCDAMPVQASRKPRITILPLHQDFKPDTPNPKTPRKTHQKNKNKNTNTQIYTNTFVTHIDNKVSTQSTAPLQLSRIKTSWNSKATRRLAWFPSPHFLEMRWGHPDSCQVYRDHRKSKSSNIAKFSIPPLPEKEQSRLTKIPAILPCCPAFCCTFPLPVFLISLQPVAKSDCFSQNQDPRKQN